MKKRFLLFLCVATMSVAHAQLLTENFSYTSTGTPANDFLTNPAIGSSRWTRHSGLGTYYIFWRATGLTYAGYSGSGMGGSVSFINGPSSREDVNSTLSDSVKTGSVYLSFMLNVTASGGTTGDYNIHFVSGSGIVSGGFIGRVFIKDGSTAGTFQLGLSKGSTAAAAVFTTADYNLNTTYLVVMKYTFNIVTATDDVISAYIFTSGVPATEPTVASLVATDITVNDISKIYGVAIRQSTVGTASAILDGFAVHNGWFNTTMPVELIQFDAHTEGSKNRLTWHTASETNNSHFDIERSTDGNSFHSIGQVKGNNKASSYQFVDNAPLATSYYRLRQIDNDGKETLSKVISVERRDAINRVSIKVYPNPVSNTLTVEYTEGSLFQVINLLGQQVLTGKTPSGGRGLDVSALPQGTYFLKVGTEQAKFIKQ